MSGVLEKERKNIGFNTRELTDLFNGSSSKAKLKEEIYKKVYEVEAFRLDDFYFLSREQRMRRVHEKCFHLQKFLHENSIKPLTEEFWIVMGAINDDLPLLIHYFLFLPTLMGQADEEQLKIWAPLANRCEIIGCYAQTEIGHGSNVRGLETTATFIKETDEFELHSPTLTSSKCWIGALGLTATHAVVFAQLLIDNKNYGVHPFLTPIRSLETHKPFKGIKVGDIGPKFGFNGMDNGFLRLDHYRIPRRNMLMKFAKVTKDGKYSRPPHEKTAYGTMIFARVTFLGGSANHLSKAVTIGIRYGLQRKQFHSKMDQKDETIILDYPSQQYKLFPLLATAYAFKFTSQYIWNMYGEIMKSMSTSDFSFLGEFHALLSGLKSTFTDISANGIEECFIKGTLVLMKDGTKRKIEDIQVGEEVLGDDSTPRKVISKQVGKDITYKITEKTFHKDDSIYGRIEYTCNSRHLLVVETSKFVSEITTKIDKRTKLLYEFFSYNKLDKLIIDEKPIDMVIRKERRIYHKNNGGEKKSRKQAEEERNEIIKRNGNETFFKWLVEAKNLKYIGEKVRSSTIQRWAPILIEKKDFKNFCVNELGVKEENIKKISWLLGLWIGDGYTSTTTISVNIKDKDEIQRIRDYCNDLGLNASEPRQSEKKKENENLGGYIEIHSTIENTDNNSEKPKYKCKTKNNILWNLILTFGLNKNKRKSISDDFHLQEIYVREWFLAGLIDSDGHYRENTNFIVITTIYDEIRDGLIRLSKSLGIRVSVTSQVEHIDKMGQHHKKYYSIALSMCSVLQNILSKCSITGKYSKEGGSKQKYMEPPEKVEYLNQPFYFDCEKIQEIVNIQKSKKISIEDLSDAKIKEFMKENNKFGYTHKDLENLTKENEELEQIDSTLIARYISDTYKESPRSRAVCLFVLNENYEMIKNALNTKIKKIDIEQEYIGITLDNESNSLFLLDNNCVVHNCRKACGGHGYSKASGLADQYAFFVHYCTAEGDNTIMAHQLAKFLKKSFQNSQQGKKSNLKFFSYFNDMKRILNEKSTVKESGEFLDSKEQLKTLEHRIAYLVNSTFSKNTSFEDETIEGSKISRAQSIYVIALSFIDSLQKFPEKLQTIMKNLSDLFCLYHIESNAGDLLMDQYLNEKQVEMIRFEIKNLMKAIRVDALGLVDSFNWTDRDLLSALGCKDGNAYENLIEFYERNPLNQSDVTPSYHEFIRPIIKQQYSKL